MSTNRFFRVFKPLFNRLNFLLVSNLNNFLAYKAIGSILLFQNIVNPLPGFIFNEFTLIE